MDKSSVCLCISLIKLVVKHLGKDNEILEFTYKTPTEAITYSSGGVLYDTFKTFSIKIALVAETTYDMPRVRDMRAIALD